MMSTAKYKAVVKGSQCSYKKFRINFDENVQLMVDAHKKQFPTSELT